MEVNYPYLKSLKNFDPRYRTFEKIFITSDIFTIGRDLENCVAIPFLSISRHHCKIWRTNNNAWFIGNYSTNGIYVNNVRLDKGNNIELKCQDIINLVPSSEFKYEFIVPQYQNPTNFERRTEDAYGSYMERMSELSQFMESPFMKKNIEMDPMEERSLKIRTEDYYHTTQTQDLQRRESLVDEVQVNLHDIEQDYLTSSFRHLSDKRLEDYFKNHLKYAAQVCQFLGKLKKCIDTRTRLQAKLKEREKFPMPLKKKKLVEAKLQRQPERELQIEELEATTQMPIAINKTTQTSEQESIWAKFADIMENEFQCSICSEIFVNPTTLNCTHTFCKSCITQWQKKSKECPMCRAYITGECGCSVLDSFIDTVITNMGTEMQMQRLRLLQLRGEFEYTSPNDEDVLSDSS